MAKAKVGNASNSTATVAVGCKLPNGLHLDIGETRVTLKGANAARVFGGFGVTEGVDKSFYEEWCRINAQHPALKNGLIFAEAEADSVEDRGEEQAELRSGFEQLNPNELGKGVTAVTEDGEG